MLARRDEVPWKDMRAQGGVGGGGGVWWGTLEPMGVQKEGLPGQLAPPASL